MTVHTPHTRSHLSSVPLDQDIHRLCLGRGHHALLLGSRSFVSQDSHGSVYVCNVSVCMGCQWKTCGVRRKPDPNERRRRSITIVFGFEKKMRLNL